VSARCIRPGSDDLSNYRLAGFVQSFDPSCACVSNGLVTLPNAELDKIIGQESLTTLTFSHRALTFRSRNDIQAAVETMDASVLDEAVAHFGTLDAVIAAVATDAESQVRHGLGVTFYQNNILIYTICLYS
jgi:hypothetical protein